MKPITCMCEKKFEADFPDTIDLGRTPEVVREIIDGSFMNVTCPACHKVLKPEFPFKIFDAKADWELHFIPELIRQENMKNPPALSGRTTMRLVIGYAELCEKIKIFSQNLDDRTVEYLKYVILSKVLEKTNSEEKDIAVYYSEKKGDELLFHIQGLKDGEVALFKIPTALYQKTLAEIDTRAGDSPFSEFLVPPYVSLNRLYSWDDYEE